MYGTILICWVLPLIDFGELSANGFKKQTNDKIISNRIFSRGIEVCVCDQSVVTRWIVERCFPVAHGFETTKLMFKQ